MDRRKGFTLMELLVVIAIIAILLAILTPGMRKVKEIAREMVCRSNMRSVGMAILMYLGDNERKLADPRNANRFLWYDSRGNVRTTSDHDAYWGVVYIDYLKDTKIFGCPSFHRVPELIYDVDPKAIQHAALGLSGYARGLDTTQIRPHSEFIIAHDHVEPRFEQDTRDMLFNKGPGTKNLTDYRQGGHRSEHYRGIFRHNIRFSDPFRTGGRTGVLWLDGHVSPIEETTGDNIPKRWYTGER
jgi:prepilin-type N-terminal cleavage/methylation domain-containing protein/prepilin-type processing-associated H-X9-DG protein